MVGRVAVAAAAASPLLRGNDGDVQPCKKRREEDASVKTITRYFSPLAKPVDKALSSPKSNNILDYFKKTSATENAAFPVEAGENKTLLDADDKECKSSFKPSLKRKRKGKKVNLNNMPKEIKESENEVEIEISSDDSRVATGLQQDSHFIAACTLVDKKSARGLAEDNDQRENFPNTVPSRKNSKNFGCETNGSKNRIRKSRKRKHRVNVDLSESSYLENQMNEMCKKETEEKTNTVAECDAAIASPIAIGDSSFEVHMDDGTSQVNNCIVTVSFEDFLRSQGENNVEEDTKPAMDASGTANEMDRSDSITDPEKCEESQQLPLRTVTVLAQVHSIPPKLPPSHKEQKGSRKIASIFLKQKGRVGEKESSPALLDSEQTEQVTQKRKSNVVIEEEELELAVLETPGSDSLRPKCTLEEKHQFMKAFRQPTADGTKSGGKKAPGKQKQAAAKSSKEKEASEDVPSNKGLESGIPEDHVDKDTHSKPKSNRTKPRRSRKVQRKGNRRKKASETKETNVSNTSNYIGEEDSDAGVVTVENTLDVMISSSPEVSELRRSLRQQKTKTSTNVTPKKPRARSACSADELNACPLETSTPKAHRQSCKKSNMYRAEVITVPFDGNSPIRMRFTRIKAATKSNKAEAMKNEESHSKNTKTNSTSKNISKAKQLIEKAKAIQQSRSKVHEDSAAPVRRSSRQRALAEKKKSEESDESVIILGSSMDNGTTTEQSVKEKKLRSLNDVLGKKSKNLKVTKNSNGKLSCPPSSLGKNAQNSEPIVIFDESSQDASENSQDDDAFRAKREFLMSGLPESLKRQIAKKAAAMEAYSLASSCFKTVVHVQQKDDCSPMWKLQSPSCPLLTKLRELSTEVTNITKITLSLGEFSTVNSKRTVNCSAPVLSGHRPAFPDAFKKDLLDEILASNSQFPVRKYYSRFLKRQTERLALENSTQESRDGTANLDVIEKHPYNWKETKRKRKETEDRKSKRRKYLEGTETEMKSRVSRNLTPPISGEKQAETGQAIHLEKNKTQKPDGVTEDTGCLSDPSALSGVEKEDMLWTEKYQPQDSSELVGNKKEIERLHSWLKEWKKRADLEEKRNQKREKQDKEQEDSLSSLDFKDGTSDTEEETTLCNTVLITGPPGVGKTAAVYACAQELGFKIFEVNASCQRSGRQILSQLKEATQSHQVDKKGVNAHKPCFFNSCSTAKSPKKMYSPKKVISPRKPPLSPKGAGLKRSLPCKTLANYFKISVKRKVIDGEATSEEKHGVILPAARNTQNSLEVKKDAQVKSINKEEGEHNRKSATSLILFEEVDIIFDEDAGFLSAIKTFMATAKRPVILTTNDPTFSLMFDGYFEEINFKTPSLINSVSYLQALCLAENLRTDGKDLAALLTTNNCDIRQSVLSLQFWVRSGGGCLKEKHLAPHGGEDTRKADNAIHPAKLNDSKVDFSPADEAHLQEFPKCDTGCVETLLGLKNILLPSEDLFTFLKHKITTMEEWNKLMQLLTEFQMKHVDFVYSNLELILPLPVQVLSNQSEASKSVLERTTVVSSKDRSTKSSCSGKSSPGKRSKKTKKRLEILDDSDLFDSQLNYSAEFITLQSNSPKSCAEMNKKESKLLVHKEQKEVKTKTSANEERSAVVSQCLNSLTEFVENMSFLDCCVNTNTREPLEFSKSEEFHWTNAKIRNGLCDEFSIENTDWWSSQSCSEIKAAIEALSFTKTSVNISQHLQSCLSTSKTPESDQLKGLALPVSNTRNCISFSQAANSSTHKKAQKRLAVIKSVFSRSPLNLGNKQASTLEYLPTLRSICRSEKLKEQGKTKRRFLHYLEGIHLEIPRQMINGLSLDFP